MTEEKIKQGEELLKKLEYLKDKRKDGNWLKRLENWNYILLLSIVEMG